MNFSVSLRDVTHVVIKTGHAPPLAKLLPIEELLRGKLGRGAAVIFACSALSPLGVLVPCPFGFRPPPPPPRPERRPHSRLGPPSEAEMLDGDAYVDRLKKGIAELVEAASGRPFYEQGVAALKRQWGIADEIYRHQRGENPRVDLYEELYEEVAAWAAPPLKPELPMDYPAYAALDEELTALPDGEEDELLPCVCSVFGEWDVSLAENDPPLMSYNARLEAAQAVIAALGGEEKAEGTLCLQVSEAVGAFDVPRWLAEHSLAYCAVSELLSFQYLETEERRVLVLEYDAEHG